MKLTFAPVMSGILHVMQTHLKCLKYVH